MNAIYSAVAGSPFSVSAAGTSLNAPGNAQRADQGKANVAILGGAGRGLSYFDPLAFKPVTEARFGTAGFNSMRGPGRVPGICDQGTVADSISSGGVQFDQHAALR